MRGFRTDLAMECIDEGGGRVEGVRVSTHHMGGITHTRIRIEKERAAELLGRHTGEYITLEYHDLPRCDAHTQKLLAALVAQGVRSLLPREGEVLVVGLGNAAMTPDAVGPLALDSVLITRHLLSAMPRQFAGFRQVSAFRTGVLGTTGVESGELVRAVTERIHPACVIAVDALASRSLKRVCTTVQLADTGIVPGSGVGNDRAAVNRESLGLPVVAMGVPTVVDASAFSDSPDAAGMFVTPRDIDASVRDVAKLIGYGINLALHDGLSVADVDMLKS